jgi:hypothetical protein
VLGAAWLGGAATFPETQPQRESWGMTLPTTAQELYDLLAGDAVVAQALGTYTPRGGTAIPAIALVRRNESLPEGVAVAGLEVVILANPEYAPQAMLTGEQALNPQFRLYISEWSPASGLLALQALTQRIIALLPGCRAVPIGGDPPGQGLGVLDQYALSWTNPTQYVVTPEA